MNKLKKTLLISCFILIVIFLGGGIFVTKFFKTFQREPAFPIEELLSQQENVLEEGWVYLNVEESDITKDADFTLALWAIYTGFTFHDGLAYFSEELHVFANPLKAKLISNPSPRSVLSDDYFIPKEWNYTPRFADKFQLRCYGGDFVNIPENCLGCNCI